MAEQANSAPSSCDRDTLAENMASPGCPVHAPLPVYPPPNPTCDRCKPYPGDPCICHGYGC